MNTKIKIRDKISVLLRSEEKDLKFGKHWEGGASEIRGVSESRLSSQGDDYESNLI